MKNIVTNPMGLLTNMYRTNFWGSVYPTHCVIPHLMKTKGKIVVNASSAGVLHPPNGGFYTVTLPIHLAYFSVMSLLCYSIYLTQPANKKMMTCASKAALISFFESLRFEVSPTITITILTLGFINTNIITANYSTKGVGVRLRKDFKDVVPTMEAEPCAKAIVDGVCKGVTSITTKVL
ncbi:putative 11-beta-hydroxysteroid dehydrogenase [Helianthus annuus]|nr:putative 11-beta-hydroxysteroid dehydrogenase [Helianthus annuus]KAJ0635247.1 putative 11-beta-hydroxysteroid dehydrogenase [Helianthus annuus]